MRLGGRIMAAAEILEQVERERRPVTAILRDWGHQHRFAGSGDRAAIGNLVFDSLRRRLSNAWRMDDDGWLAGVLATVIWQWDVRLGELSDALAADRFGPGPLTDRQTGCLLHDRLQSAPKHVRADVPDWLYPKLEDNFEDEAMAEGMALAARAPIDLRANTLKTNPEKVVKALKRFGAERSVISPIGVRLPSRKGPGRPPNVQAEAGYQRGHFEIQDEGSQIAALLIGARPGEQVLDFCAGGGGKTLALSAAMENRGQVHAYDIDANRLAPIHDRLKRAGARNVQVHPPDGALENLIGRMDRVLVDAPCTGTGVWRRHPESKWKLTPEALETRKDEQQSVLAEAAQYVRPGGYLVYVTCSVLAEENEGGVAAFLESNPAFEQVTVGEVWQDTFGFDKPRPWSDDLMSVTLTPASTNTDGFFVAVMERRLD